MLREDRIPDLDLTKGVPTTELQQHHGARIRPNRMTATPEYVPRQHRELRVAATEAASGRPLDRRACRYVGGDEQGQPWYRAGNLPVKIAEGRR